MAVDLSGSSSAASSSTSTLAANTFVKDTSINVSASGSVQETSIVIPVPPPPPPRAPVIVPKTIPKVKKAPVAPGDRVQTRSRSYADVAAEGGAAGGSGIVRYSILVLSYVSALVCFLVLFHLC